ncbi:MAG: hypothetical protein IT492_24250 [Gammaproteobacteria bacterium]|nr:hypothetical protein [Gammaproteobacteria bacterium]
MSCISDCLEELRAKRAQLDEAIVALERFGTGAGKRRGRRPNWLRAAEGENGASAERKPQAASKPAKKAKKRNMSAEGKLAIQAGVRLRAWRGEHPEAKEEEIAKQRARFQAELRRGGRVVGAA